MKYVQRTLWYLLLLAILLAPLGIIAWWSPKHALAMVPALLLMIIAVVLLAPRLAKTDKFWTFIPGNMAKIAVASDERNGKPIRPLYNKDTHTDLRTQDEVGNYYGLCDKSRFPKDIEFKIGDVVPLDALPEKNRPDFARPIGLIEYLWGITWVGIYPFRKVYCYDFDGTILRNQGGKDILVKKSNRWTTFLLQDETYVSPRDEVEIFGNITIQFWLATTLRGINPMKMAFAHHNSLDATFSQILLPKTEEFCRQPPEKKLRAKIGYQDAFGWFSEERRGEIDVYLHRETFDDIHNRYGLLLIQNEMINLDPGKEYRDLTTAKARETLQGEAKITRAEYDLQKTKKEADGIAYTAEKTGAGQAAAIKVVAQAVNAGGFGGDTAADLLRVKEIAGGQGAFLVQAAIERLGGTAASGKPARRVIIPEEIKKEGDH